MKMHWKQNQKIHGVGRLLKYDHEVIGKIALNMFQLSYSELNEKQAFKLYFYLKEQLRAIGWRETNKGWEFFSNLAPKKKAKSRSGKLKMSHTVNSVIHREAKTKGISHEKVLFEAKRIFDKDYIALNDSEAWRLYYKIIAL